MLVFNFSWIACLFLLICWSGFANSLYEGDKCTLKNGDEGICKVLTDCPSGLKLLRAGVFPKICGFVGTVSIICCGGDSSPITTTTTVRSITTTTVPSTTTTATQPAQTQSTTTQKSEVPLDTNGMPGDISKRKCKEYAEYAYDRSDAPTLALFAQKNDVLECAFEKLQLIVGGTLASRQEFPHMALIGYKTDDDGINWGCGGSIISENYILTASHCLNSRQFGDPLLVRVGMTNQSDTTYMQEREVAESIPYPKYVDTKYHDIGVLKLSKNLELNTFVRPACLQTERNIRFQKAIASGWGQIEFTGSVSKDLLKVVLEFFDEEHCNKTHGKDIIRLNSRLKEGIIDDFMICAGSTTDKKDTCRGDSGGPLQVYHDESDGVQCMYDIVGVTASGRSCGLSKSVPGIYTRVSAYIEWIEDTVWPN